MDGEEEKEVKGKGKRKRRKKKKKKTVGDFTRSTRRGAEAAAAIRKLLRWYHGIMVSFMYGSGGQWW